jgi:hypothetical protein
MTGNSISEGEANSMRERLRAVEVDASKAKTQIDIHEATCSTRYRNLVLLILLLAGANSMAAFPHITQILALLK